MFSGSEDDGEKLNVFKFARKLDEWEISMVLFIKSDLKCIKDFSIEEFFKVSEAMINKPKKTDKFEDDNHA